MFMFVCLFVCLFVFYVCLNSKKKHTGEEDFNGGVGGCLIPVTGVVDWGETTELEELVVLFGVPLKKNLIYLCLIIYFYSIHSCLVIFFIHVYLCWFIYISWFIMFVLFKFFFSYKLSESEILERLRFLRRFSSASRTYKNNQTNKHK